MLFSGCAMFFLQVGWLASWLVGWLVGHLISLSGYILIPPGFCTDVGCGSHPKNGKSVDER